MAYCCRAHHNGLADALADRGNRVVLIDLLGHGDSDKPAHARHYTMELFAPGGRPLGSSRLGRGGDRGTSLGANVTLEVAAHSPQRVRGMVIEMPVLERAAPVAAAIFLPLTIAYAEAGGS